MVCEKSNSSPFPTEVEYQSVHLESLPQCLFVHVHVAVYKLEKIVGLSYS